MSAVATFEFRCDCCNAMFEVAAVEPIYHPKDAKRAFEVAIIEAERYGWVVSYINKPARQPFLRYACPECSKPEVPQRKE